LREVVDREGPEKMLQVLADLMRLGFETVAASGASISPFIGEHLSLPAAPAADDWDAWKRNEQAIVERIESETDFRSEDFGPPLLCVKSGARGYIQHLARLAGRFGPVMDVDGSSVMIRHGFREGLTPQESFAQSVGARRGWGRSR
jgi:hypothetical protein